jgi:hypothetical protein
VRVLGRQSKSKTRGQRVFTEEIEGSLTVGGLYSDLSKR